MNLLPLTRGVIVHIAPNCKGMCVGMGGKFFSRIPPSSIRRMHKINADSEIKKPGLKVSLYNRLHPLY